jgi:hydroxymethylpyrimidine pyrophosphatase-like HAD family hydrolase
VLWSGVTISSEDTVQSSLAPGFLWREKRRILIFSICILSSVALISISLTAYVQYRTAFDDTRVRLEEIVKGRARLIEAVGRFDNYRSSNYPGGPENATLGQILSAHEHFAGFGETGEFTLARREGDRIRFLLSRRHDGDIPRETAYWDSDKAAPMKQALQGLSGSLIGLDYRGVEVLAAYEPVDGLKWGVVAKIDLAEIQATYIHAAAVALGLSALVIAMGIVVLIRITSPIIQRLEARTRELHFQTSRRTQAEQELVEARTLLLASIDERKRRFNRIEGAQATYFRAIALDYDGTLTNDKRPSNDLLKALQQVRLEGRQLVLVTGRIMAELRRDFMDVDKWFDLIVAENGAVIWRHGSRTLVAALPVEIDSALRRRQIPYRRGQVLIACDGHHANVVLEEVSRLQLDSQIVRNRGEMMLLPAGISKGTGLAEGLRVLGISPHNTIAVGDAENDLSLFEHCELSVAVANAVPSLKMQADLVLDEPAGAGVMQLLHSPILKGDNWIESKRWKILLGHTPEGDAVTLPASQVNVLITGGSGSGKSFAAGLVAEQLIASGYSVCVFDPEGDHVRLAQLRGVSLIGGELELPIPDKLFDTHQGRLGSIVINLSGLPSAERQSYVSQALPVLNEQRKNTGTPHWILVDEAHEPFSDDNIAKLISSGEKGFCLITYKPGAVLADTNRAFDFVLVVAGAGQATEVAGMVSGFTSFPEDALERFLEGAARQGQALLIRVSSLEVCALTLAPRAVTHVRHWHKYASGQLPADSHFVFRNEGALTGEHAGNIGEFHQKLECLETDSLLHHLRCHDFSRWIKEAMQDGELGAEIFTIEGRLGDAESSPSLEKIRSAILAAIHKQYLLNCIEY